MKNISLRGYNLEIEQMISDGHLQEALAHCKHILRTFPKHIDTYKLLGKAYLESGQHGNAADIFMRVLTVIPDDFVSHIGMSIIREDEGNIKSATAHMERAFEKQPYNSAIQEELRRLYGKRDGMTPPKVRLTQGALARMYYKGGLIKQSIAELRSALVEEPDRIDLQALLAQAYADSNQTPKALSIASEIIKKYPHNLTANIILSNLLKDREDTPEMKACRQRLYSLSPYHLYISEETPTTEDVSAKSITLEALSWDPSMAPAGGEEEDIMPEWAASIGADLGSDEEKEQVPGWMAEVPGEAPESASEEQTPLPEADIGDDEEELEETPQEDEIIPAWMKEAGWESSDGTVDESRPIWDFEEEDADRSQDEELAPADIPDWLKEKAPLEFSDQQPGLPSQDDETLLEELDDQDSWLAEFDDEQGGPIFEDNDQMDASSPLPGFVPDEEQEVDVPDWLTEEDGEEIEELPAQTQEPFEETLPDWLEEDDLEAEPVEREELPDWLDGSQLEAEPEETILPDSDDRREEEGVLPGDGVEAPGDEEQPLPRDVFEDDEPGDYVWNEEEIAEMDEEEIPAWLESLADVQPPDLPGESEEIPRGLPADDMVEEDMVEEEPTSLEQEETALDDGEAPAPVMEQEELPGEIEEKETAQLAESEAVEDEDTGYVEQTEDLPDWLLDLSKEEEPQDTAVFWLEEDNGPEEVEHAIDGAARASRKVPKWLAELEELEKEEKEQRKQEAVVPDDFEEAAGAELDFPEEFDLDDEEATMAWMESLAEKQGISQEELISSPEERAQARHPIIKKDEPAGEDEMIGEEEEDRPPDEEEAAWFAELERQQEQESAPREQEKSSRSDDMDSDLPDWFDDLEDDEEFTGTPVFEEGALEDLKADQVSSAPAAESEPGEPGEDVSGEMPLPPEQPSSPEEDWPQWLKDGTDELNLPEEEQEPADEKLPAWFDDVEEESFPAEPAENMDGPDIAEEEDLEEEPSRASLPDRDSEELPRWLSNLKDDEEPQETAIAWLSDFQDYLDERHRPEKMEPDSAAGEDQSDQAAREETLVEEEQEPAEIEPEPHDQPPSWVIEGAPPDDGGEEYTWVPGEEKIDLNTASLAQLENLDQIGFIIAEAIISYRKKNGPFEDISDLMHVPGVDQEHFEILKNRTRVIEREEKAPSSPEPEDEFQALLIKAKQAVENDEIDLALETYQVLIDEKEYLPEVVDALNDASYKYPMNVAILKLLGDTYMRMHELQKALDTYSKAEDLLR